MSYFGSAVVGLKDVRARRKAGTEEGAKKAGCGRGVNIRMGRIAYHLKGIFSPWQEYF
jgi:hypothetical protein